LPQSATTSVVIKKSRLRISYRVANEIGPGVMRFGSCVSARKLSPAFVLSVTPPRLTQYNHWGQRIDQFDTSEAWKGLKAVCFKEGIPGIFYE
jgi:hypothetical protein